MSSELERLREENAMLIEDNVNQRKIIYFILEGHTSHCAQRMTFGDGECECGKVRQGCDTISVSLLKAENERLESQLNAALKREERYKKSLEVLAAATKAAIQDIAELEGRK